MALKRKDGTPYRLNSPNPLGTTQDFWIQEEKIVLHNCEWKPIAEEPAPKKAIIPDIPPPVNAAPAPKIVEKPPENKTLIHCLRARKVEKKDPLYGDVYITYEFDKKLKFYAKIVEENDFSIRMITENNEPTVGSVIFPYKGFRWWKINKILKSEDRFFIEASITNENYDFSE